MVSHGNASLQREIEDGKAEPVPGPGQPPAPTVLLRSGSLSIEAVPAHLLTPEDARAWDVLFEAQPAPSNPFLALPWVQGWYDSFVAPENRLVLVVRQDRRGGQQPDVVAIAPMHVLRQGVGPVAVARRLLPVGSGLGPNAYEIPGFLCRSGEAVQVGRALVLACAELTVDWSELALAPEQGWLDTQWPGPSEDAMTFVEFARPRACVVLPLEPSWEATRSRLKRNVKESIRRSGNRLAKDARTAEVVRRGEDLDVAAVERFLDLHQARSALATSTDRHHPDAYADERNRRLVLATLPGLGRLGQASMFELYLGGEHVASQLALHAPGTSYVHSSGFREDTWAFGPTTHLQAELVRHAADRGDAFVNFSPGPNVSKTRWSEQLWITHEFSCGAGPRSLAVRRATFQVLSSVRATLEAATRRRPSLDAGPAPTSAASSASVDATARSATA